MFEIKNQFLFPPKENYTIWRYMDFTKFMSLLEDRQLYFTRADKFEDPYEGTMSGTDVAELRNHFNTLDWQREKVEAAIAGHTELGRNFYVNCWHINKYESAAMWKLYLNAPEGIAIQSSFKKLSEALHKTTLQTRIAMVQYVDYDSDKISRGNAFYPIAYKRQSFSHENELRAIVSAFDDDCVREQAEKDSPGIMIDIDLSELIEGIYISPIASPWFGALVEKVVRRHGLTVSIVRSRLYDRPLY